MDPNIFRAYDIRGVFEEQFDQEDAWKIGNAAARFLPSLVRGYARGQAETRRIVVGYDMRIHSPGIAARLMEGIRCADIGVVDIGMVDTPQVYFAINHLKACGGIQVTASHNPSNYNGFKVSGMAATPVGEDTGLTDIKHLAIALLHTKGNATGKQEILDLTDAYKDHVLRFLSPHLRPLKIAIDASNGMAGKMVPAIFGELPLDIVKLNFRHEGAFKHEPNPLVEENLAEVKEAVKKKKCDFGLCFDGDADRLSLIDEKGQTVACDLLTALMVPTFLKQQPNSAIVYDLRSSRVVQEEIIKHGGTPRRERVGHAYMKKAMKDSQAVFGGELSGHFYYANNFCADSGLITLVMLLNILGKNEQSVSELFKPLRRYYSSGEVNFPIEDKQSTMDELAKIHSKGEIDYLDGITISFKDWWFNCRPSNTEPCLRLNIEANSKALLDKKLKEFIEKMGQPM